ncbi:hypothetical protein DYB25_012390 [Aphanomyces astaci]|uniref:UDP-galactose transporter n=1 Tax=Aphanomyces astaci TaxID=112090 RepID=A0A397DXN0_APHAT|nr:hypothetical protein DYB25_012390 [Aphanomyces astaci]RHY07790.1 hypothetical protein DYB36_012758 [Aphanomyces astaci]RHY46694.1 hypothetical protein DYB34_012747 [Aphanomyces astaci]RHY70126.1 hypothetical protein DYB38_013395 [Aphanomyces astaci]RHY71418.1 hypothetical protein DYB30_007423 [Aphanomyces astaci]
MVDLKIVSLVLLVLQNTLLGIVTKYSRGTKYNATTAVMLIEALKFVLCMLAVSVTKGSVGECIASVRREVFGDREGFKKMIFLALLYAGQNTVALLSYDYVDVATYNVVYQLKIVTTAFFMVLLLKRSFNLVQWIAMVALMIGVAICSTARPTSASAADKSNSSSFVGIAMVLGLALNSGIAAAYLELVLKTHKPHQTFTNPIDPLWKTNIQLAVISVAATGLGVTHAAFTTPSFAFFDGYNHFTYGVIGLQACGGLIIAAVVRYSDNVVKNFGTALSLVLSSLLANYLFRTSSPPLFYVGGLLVVASVFVYGDSRFHLVGSAPAAALTNAVPKGRAKSDQDEHLEEGQTTTLSIQDITLSTPEETQSFLNQRNKD